MTVTVDEKARAFLAKHNETSVYTYLGGCRTWGGVVPQPAVFAGSPDSLDDYDTFTADSITVYVRKGTQTENGSLTVTVVKMLWMDSLAVEGMAY